MAGSKPTTAPCQPACRWQQPLARAPRRGVSGDFQHRPPIRALVQRPLALRLHRTAAVRVDWRRNSPPPPSAGNQSLRTEPIAAWQGSERDAATSNPLIWWPRLLLFLLFLAPSGAPSSLDARPSCGRAVALAKHGSASEASRKTTRPPRRCSILKGSKQHRGRFPGWGSEIRRNATARNSITLCGNTIPRQGNKITHQA